MFHTAPSLLWFHKHLALSAETMLAAVCILGLGLSFAVSWGKSNLVTLGGLWLLYLSCINVGQTFLGGNW